LKQSVCCFPFVAAVFWDFRGLFEIFSKFPRATAKREWSASRGRKIQKTENTEAKHTKKKNYSRRVSREQSAQIIFNLKMKKWKSIHSYSSLVRACILYFVFSFRVRFQLAFHLHQANSICSIIGIQGVYIICYYLRNKT